VIDRDRFVRLVIYERN